MTGLILVVALTIGVSALCSFLEATLYSTPLGVLEAARDSGKRRLAERFLRMKRDISGPTSAILILNTVANTAGATLAGMYAAQILGASAVPVFTVGFTLGILLLAEILPKTIGATRWRSSWWTIVWPLTAIQKALFPAIWATQKIARWFTRGEKFPAITEDEIRASIRLGARAGQVSPSELQMLDAVFHFEDLVCRQVMVPRRDIIYLDAAWPLFRWFEVALETKHTRYPVCKGSLDEPVGLIHIKDLMGITPDSSVDLSTLIRPLRNVPETMPISKLLQEMQKTRQHMALVINEYGTSVGIITLEIVLEQIVGSVQDEFDSEWPEIQQERPGRYLIRGNVHIIQVNRELGLKLHAPKVATLSGLLVSRTGRLLKIGDRVPLEGAIAEVIEAEEGRAIRVRLELPAK